MGIEGLNRFHWIIIGGMLGAAIAFAWILAQNPQGEGDRTAFERDIVQKDPKSSNPLIKGIVIHPTEVDYQGKAKTLVSYKRLAQDKQGKLWWLDKHFLADEPYRPLRTVAGANDPGFTIQTYLTELAKQPNNDFIKFSYGWWYVPSRALLAGGLGGVLLIGGIWPTLLHLMIGAGFGRRITAEERKQIAEEKAKKKANSLWRYKSKSAPAPTGAANKGAITAADREELQAVADLYEKNVGANAVESSDKSKSTATKPTTQEVQKLETGALQEVSTKEEDETELKMREYYPTVTHHKKGEKKDGGDKKSGPPTGH